MSADNHASYTRIGFTVLIGVVAIVATLIYLGGIRGRGGETIIETYYDKPVSGLSVGSAVNFRGVKIGEVRAISFVGVKYPEADSAVKSSLIYIEMAIFNQALAIDAGEYADQEIRQRMQEQANAGLRATVSSSGITGLSQIELDYAKSEEPMVNVTWDPRHYYIPARASLMASFSVSATKVMNQINKMDLGAAWSNISASVESLARTTEGARVLVETRSSELELLMDDLSQTSASIKDLTSELKRNPSLLIRERTPTPLAETE